MRFGGLRARILGAAVVTAALAVVVVIVAAGSVVSAMLPVPNPTIPDAVVAACKADPDAWQAVTLGPLDVAVVDSAAVPDLAVGDYLDDDEGAGRRIVTRVAESGECSVFQFEFGPPDGLVSGIQIGGALGAVLAVLGVVGITYLVAVAPLLGRIDRIRSSAVRVGRDDYERADDTVRDALGEIAGVLDASNARIQADRAELIARHEALERYLAEIAHDLRTPLGSLLLALQDVQAEVDSEGARASTGRALGDAAYVADLVENLHQAARMRHGLDVAEGDADLRDIVGRLDVRFRALGAATGVEVGAAVPDEAVIVRCTPTLAERAIANLMQNAVAHGGEHVAVVLESHDAGFTLRVLDDGPGVADPADLAERTFTQDQARQRGPGLGLAITNEIVRRAGWTIVYRQGAEGGLEVEIRGSTVAGVR